MWSILTYALIGLSIGLLGFGLVGVILLKHNTGNRVFYALIGVVGFGTLAANLFSLEGGAFYHAGFTIAALITVLVLLGVSLIRKLRSGAASRRG